MKSFAGFLVAVPLMASFSRRLTILMADDDEDDRLLTQEALDDSGFAARLLFVRDGVELLDYLRRLAGRAPETPAPDLLLLDLNMPRLDGRAALVQIKTDPRLQSLPVVVLSTSSAATDISYCYRSGANSYITKAVSFAGMVEAMRHLGAYWAETVQLPPR